MKVKKDISLQVRVTVYMMERLEEKASRMGMTVADYVRYLIQKDSE
jgi:predicted DNA binding CopG/RHH family protein